MLFERGRLADIGVALALTCAAYALSSVLVVAAAATTETVRPEVGKPVVAAQALSKEKKYAEALSKLAETDEVSGKSAYEVFVIEQARAAAAAGAGDLTQAEASYERVLASDRLSPADRLAVEGSLTALAYRIKDNARTAKWGSRFLADGGVNPQIRTAVINVLYLQGDYAGAAKELQVEIMAAESGGSIAAEDRYKLLASCQLNLKDDSGYQATLTKLVALYPNKEYWADLISRVQRRQGFAERLVIDSLRLQMATSTLQAPEDYTELAQLELEAGYAVQAKKVIDLGFSSGTLGVGSKAPVHQQLRTKIQRAAELDAKAGTTPPSNAKDGSALFSAGLNQFYSGQADTGLAWMEEGVAKGGLKNPDDARMRIGMAYALAGRQDKATQTLNGVSGRDGATDLAQLWLLYAQQGKPK